MKLHNTVEGNWKSYRRHVIPDDAPDIQIIESRRAFIAGATTTFALVTEATSADDLATFNHELEKIVRNETEVLLEEAEHVTN